MSDPICDRCDQPKSRHNDVMLFCPFYSTFRLRGPAPGGGSPPEAEQIKVGNEEKVMVSVERYNTLCREYVNRSSRHFWQGYWEGATDPDEEIEKSKEVAAKVLDNAELDWTRRVGGPDPQQGAAPEMKCPYCGSTRRIYQFGATLFCRYCYTSWPCPCTACGGGPSA